MGLTHFDGAGAPRMVDVGAKPQTDRVAVAAARIEMQPETLAMIRAQLDGRESSLPKGDVVGVARVAGIMAAKRTPDLIPLCHPLPLSGIDVAIEPTWMSLRVLRYRGHGAHHRPHRRGDGGLDRRLRRRAGGL